MLKRLQVAISTGSLLAGWLMRKTGKLYMLTIVSAVLSVVANTLVASWSNRTSPVHLWVCISESFRCSAHSPVGQLDVVPQGFGMSSLITSTLIAVIATVSKQDMAVATGSEIILRL
jgi:MFS family permease